MTIQRSPAREGLMYFTDRCFEVDGIRYEAPCEMGDTHVRPMFEAVRDDYYGSGARMRPGDSIDESMWLRYGLILDAES
jgi:hypothetical protein